MNQRIYKVMQYIADETARPLEPDHPLNRLASETDLAAIVRVRDRAIAHELITGHRLGYEELKAIAQEAGLI